MLRLIQLERRQQVILLVLVGVILFGGGYRLAQVKERSAVKPVLETAEQSRVKSLNVHVTGAVTNPGVYVLEADARIIDAVNKAVPMGDADLDSLKLAAKVIDGQDIYVPFEADRDGPAAAGSQPGAPGTSRSGGMPAGTGFAANSLVNINTADAAQLDTLPGIGSSLAQRIIQYRENNGPFKAIEDLKDVSGIGDKNFENLKDRITVY
ncbi:helix-hairpin-helix domain-containing protein [Pelotomaculum propionicicum]|uniref:helix-hairpin-helix domain-containing protein n=1 Tax=Pelotomaculum propionicicum TaxID=258475 RepID=UPI003B7F444C